MVLIEVVNATVETINPITESSLRIFTFPFTIPVDPGQKIDFARVFAQIEILDNAGTQLAARVLFNGREVGSNIWAQFETTTFIVDQSVSLAGIKANEINEITIMIEQKFSPFFATAKWRLFADFFYTVRNEITGEPEEPSVTPVLEDVEVIEVPEAEDDIFGFDIVNFLFGDVNKTVRTIAIVGVVVAAAVLIPPVARAITATQRLRRKTAV